MSGDTVLPGVFLSRSGGVLLIGATVEGMASGIRNWNVQDVGEIAAQGRAILARRFSWSQVAKE